MKTRVIHSITVTADPRPPGDFGGASMSGITETEAESRAKAEELARRIRQHCADLLPSMSRHMGVSVVPEAEDVCSHCGSPWTQAGTEYNGGCCDEDLVDQTAALLVDYGPALAAFQDGNQVAIVRAGFVDLQESDVIAWLPLPSSHPAPERPT